MGIQSTVGHALGGLLDISSDDTDAKRAQLENLLKTGALHDAANMGLHNGAGANIVSGLAAGAKNPIGVDTTLMDSSDAGLAAAKAHYLDQYRNGGPEGQAAVQAAAQASGLMSQGGGQGVRDQILASAGRQGQVADIAQAERTAAGGQTNALDAQTAAQALQKAMFSAQVTHANLQLNLARQKTLFDLQNTQAGLNNQAQLMTNDASNAAASTAIDQQSQEAKIGAQVLSFLTSAGSKGLGTATSAFGQKAADLSTDYSAGMSPQASTAAGLDPTGAGYVQQAAPVVRIFPTAPAMPVQRSDWLGRKS